MRSLFVALALGVGLGGCQSADVSRELGARCITTSDCDLRCLVPSTEYPGGFCTRACNTASECPSGSSCTDVDGGVCLFDCATDPDCAFLGAGWTCKQLDVPGGQTKVMVCRGD